MSTPFRYQNEYPIPAQNEYLIPAQNEYAARYRNGYATWYQNGGRCGGPCPPLRGVPEDGVSGVMDTRPERWLEAGGIRPPSCIPPPSR
jgi:hypothetical protein